MDRADLHYAVNDAQGRKGEQNTRLNPRGWSCIVVAEGSKSTPGQTNFNRTYFAKNDAKLGDIDTILRKFLEIEEVRPSAIGP